jgi:hypothetical protein
VKSNPSTVLSGPQISKGNNVRKEINRIDRIGRIKAKEKGKSYRSYDSS